MSDGKKFDPAKPVQTRDGKSARIVCTNADGPYPIVALFVEGDREEVRTYTEDGKFDRHNPHKGSLDFVNIPEKTEGWVNFYDKIHPLFVPEGNEVEFPGVSVFKSREAADLASFSQRQGRSRIACIYVSFTDGEGL